MDFLRQQLVIIQERLRGLTPSQKLLAGALVVIMMMTMLYWGRFASSGETVSLFSNPANPAELSAVTTALTNNGIKFTAVGGNVRVPLERQEEAIAAIATAVAMPNGGTSDALESMLDKFSPLATQNEFNARLQSVRNRNLVATIQGWPGVKSARVLITESVRGSLTPAPAGASIDITTNGDVNGRKLAKTALYTVLPAVAYLKAENVAVSVNGVSVLSGGGTTGGFDAGDLMESQRAYEMSIEQAIRDAYKIDGLLVSITAEVTAETRSDKITTPDIKNKVSMPIETIGETTTTTDAAPPAEPGAVPNMSLDASAGPAGSRGGSKMERNEERFENKVGMTESLVSTPAGKPKVLGAIVRVPLKHFIQMWKARHKEADPTDEELDGLVKRELDKMRGELVAKTMLTDSNALVVNEYTDLAGPSDVMLASTAVSTTGAGTISALAGSHGKEVAIGALALTSLFMVGRMVKKSSPPPTPPLLTLDDMPDVSSVGIRRNGSIGGVDIAGEVAEGGSVMMGQELDEEVLETSQMVEQVSGFVKDHPDTTAQLLKRWMNR
jgi:flagellar biosynthesis/type III secretory pathway M-ring protein FliF/YscJ